MKPLFNLVPHSDRTLVIDLSGSLFKEQSNFRIATVEEYYSIEMEASHKPFQGEVTYKVVADEPEATKTIYRR